MNIRFYEGNYNVGVFQTNSESIPRPGDIVETVDYEGRCEHVSYFYDKQGNCDITVRAQVIR